MRTNLAVVLVLVCYSVLPAQNLGPIVGLRVTIYDKLCAAKLGHEDATCYRYLKPNPLQFQIDPDPSGTSDGILSLKTGALGAASYVGGPTGAIIVDNTKNPPEIDIATSIVPQKGLSETIDGKWNFTQPITTQNQLVAIFTWQDSAAAPNRGYRIYRAAGPCTLPITFTQVHSSSVPATFFDMTVPSPGIYCYTVRAVVDGVEEDNPNTIQLTVDPVQFVMVGQPIASLPPTVGTSCGVGAIWSAKAGMFLCSDLATVSTLLWALLPMQGQP